MVWGMERKKKEKFNGLQKNFHGGLDKIFQSSRSRVLLSLESKKLEKSN
jgi:hypothetical protein